MILAIITNLATFLLCTIFALATATVLTVTNDSGTMTWFARPYFLLPLYIFPSLGVALILFTVFKDGFASRLIGSRGNVTVLLIDTNLDIKMNSENRLNFYS